MHGMQPTRILSILAQRLAQQAHYSIQHILGDVPVAPDRIQQFVASEHPTGRTHEQREHGESLGLQSLFGATARQPPAREVDDHVVKGKGFRHRLLHLASICTGRHSRPRLS